VSLLEATLRRPVSVVVGVLLCTLAGVIAVFSLPIQLTPNVDKPIVTVSTFWEGASPQEIEQEILEEQEDKLKSVEGLQKMTSTAVESSGTIELELSVGADLTRALFEVSDKLRQVPKYPENVDEPVIQSGESQGTNAIAWFILMRTKDSPWRPEDVPRLRTLMLEVVKPRLERAAGVSDVGVIGGIEREVHVRIDPEKLASRSLTLLDVQSAFRGHHVDVSAGTFEQGKRSYVVRTVGKFRAVEEIDGLLLAWRDGRPVFLRDVGEAALSYKEETNVVRSVGEPSIAINAMRQSGTNVMRVMEALKKSVAEVNRDILEPKGLHLVQVYDQTGYINDAIQLIVQNLYVGGALTILILLLFLRDWRSMTLLALSIPISVICSIPVLNLLGRNLNVISLAGLSFAVGMVVDNSIVVLENIHRHREMGKRAFVAALDGVREVWGAVLASTLTTLAVFVPVVFVQEEAGQLFKDIAIAISASVFASLLVSVWFIPTATTWFEHQGRASSSAGRTGLSWLHLFDRSGRWIQAAILGTLRRANRSTATRLFTVGSLTAASVGLTILLRPPMAYLPQGNQNLVIGIVVPPPGYNFDEFTRIGEQIETVLRPYWKVRDGQALSAAEQFPDWYDGERPIPGLLSFFFVARGQAVFMGGRSADDSNVVPLIKLFERAAGGVPGVMVFANQTSLFARGVDGAASVELEIAGHDPAEIHGAAAEVMQRVTGKLGHPRAEPPNFMLGSPELQLKVDERRAAELGFSVRDVGFVVQSMIDGAVIGEFESEGQTIDVKLLPLAAQRRPIEQLAQIPVHTPSGRDVPLSSIATIRETTGPTQILHVEEQRAVRLIVQPPAGMGLSRAMEILESQVLGPMRAEGRLEKVSTFLSGTADKLVSTRRAMQWNLLLALLITYLLMAALFESFLHPFVIMFSVPLAAVGGIAGLRLLHHFTGQQMDVLTMLGFVILIGTVVNNAILIVYQALNLLREGEITLEEAVLQSVSTRIRPIFMTTTTTVLGMTPLILFPGAGSELYRGLGSVIVGGLIVSTMFTLFVVPALFTLLGTAQMKRFPRAFRRSLGLTDRLDGDGSPDLTLARRGIDYNGL